MAKTRKVLKKQVSEKNKQNNKEIVEKASVKDIANVNKAEDRNGRRKSRLQKRKLNELPQKEEAVTKCKRTKSKEEQKGKGKTKNESITTQVDGMKGHESVSENVDCKTKFMEDDEEFQMAVTGGNESYCQSEEEGECSFISTGEAEVNFRRSSSRSRGPMESDSNVDNSESSYDSEMDFDDDESVKILPKSREQRLKELDIEMREKLEEIHDIMNEGGMTESVGILENHFNILSEKERNKRSKGKNNNASVPGRVRNLGKQVKGKDDITNSMSEETVYTGEVKQRTSSSSDEEGIVMVNDGQLDLSNLSVSSQTFIGDEDFSRCGQDQ